MRKLLLSIGTIAAVVVPVTTVVACSTYDGPTKVETTKSSVPEVTFPKPKLVHWYNRDNTILMGEAVADKIRTQSPIGKDEHLVKIDQDKVKTSLDGHPDVVTLYYAN